MTKIYRVLAGLLFMAAIQAASAQTLAPRVTIVNGGAGGTEAGQTGSVAGGGDITVRLVIDVTGASATNGSDSYAASLAGGIELSFTSTSSPAASASSINGWIDAMISGFSVAADYNKLHDDTTFTDGSTWVEGTIEDNFQHYRLIEGKTDGDGVLVNYADQRNSNEPRGAWCTPSGGRCAIVVGDFTFTLPDNIGAGTLEFTYTDLGTDGILLRVPAGATEGTAVPAAYNVVTASADVNGDTDVDHLDAVVMYLSYTPDLGAARGVALSSVMGHLVTTHVPTAQGLLDNAVAFQTQQ